MTTAFSYRTGFLGCPSKPDVPWTQENIQRLVDLGFNCVQLNIAWGSRPADEPLNLEDVVNPSGVKGDHKQTLPLRSGQEEVQIEKRRAVLKERIALCREAGLRTIFHFGAPYNMHARFGDSPPNCLVDMKVRGLYAALLEAFAEQFPGVDDILLYTYDQDAWLCSEFGECPRCVGVPLHGRVSGFVNLLAQTWLRVSRGGRLWWEPWELSAGQVLHSIRLLDSSCVGLALHSNIAEVMATMPVDRWLRIAAGMARKAGIPVMVEHFLGGPTEEVEPFLHLCWPLVTLRALRAIAALDVAGIKEYYGLVPTKEDPNLRMTSLFFANPGVSEEEALQEIAGVYGKCADEVILFWRATSEAMEMFPWNTSWYIREVGKCDPSHSMSAAFVRGQQAHTPSWESSRRAVFMKTDNVQPDSWLLEDVQLQCELAADRIREALALGESIRERVPTRLRGDFEAGLRDLRAWRQRALSYAYHIRETNLTRIMRERFKEEQPVPEHVLRELKGVLTADMENQGKKEPCSSAIRLLDTDPQKFAGTYFLDDDSDGRKRGPFSMTSR